MPGRLAASAALAASLLAGDVVLLTSFLNPQLALWRDGPGLLVSLFLPYALAGTLVLWALATVARLAWRRSPEPRPPLEGLPWFTTLAVIALTAAAALFWANLLGYRHSIPLPFLRGLLGSAIALTASVLVLLAVVAD